MCTVCCHTGCPQRLCRCGWLFAPTLNGPLLPHFLSSHVQLLKMFYLFLQYLLFFLAPISRTLYSFLLCFLYILYAGKSDLKVVKIVSYIRVNSYWVNARGIFFFKAQIPTLVLRILVCLCGSLSTSFLSFILPSFLSFSFFPSVFFHVPFHKAFKWETYNYEKFCSNYLYFFDSSSSLVLFN